LDRGYAEQTRGSKVLYERARRVFAGGVNHNARYYVPYPIFAASAKGQHLWDEDGNRYVDYWMGHMALILGHSPRIVTEALKAQLAHGTHYGTGNRLSIELGEEVQRDVPCAEMVRFCNTGAEATMYLVRLARGYTGKKMVIKIAGGWHGYNTDLNKGVHTPFSAPESAGILPEEQAHVRTVSFNRLDLARKAVKAARGDLAVILLEPVLGAGGCIPAEEAYLNGLRELADGAGALLAFDEIITGFRVALGGAQERYGVTPDLAARGKIMGGGLPVGAVTGSKEIMSLADPSRKNRFVSIGGGTFSENPLSMAAGLATVRYLRQNRERVYGRLERAGKDLRSGVDRALSEGGIEASTTGMGSLFMTHFGRAPKNAEESAREDASTAYDYALFLISRGHFLQPGHLGGISTAHTDEDLADRVKSSEEFANSRRVLKRK